MKNLMYLAILLFALLTVSNPAVACDICGCSGGGNSLGILPQFNSNFIGMRYQYKAFDSEHLTLFPGEIPLMTTEKFHTVEMWGRFAPFKNLHLFTFVPYNYYSKEEGNLHSTLNGLGDISLLANYVILNSTDYTQSNWKHALQVGLGIKLPTGSSDHIQNNTGLLIPSLQLGTGSVDIPMNLIYTVRYNDLGINLENNHRINTTNRRNYKFGNNFSSAVRVFYLQKLKNLTLLPQLGAIVEYGAHNRDRGEHMEYTEGKGIYGNLGFDLYFDKFILNLSVQVPIKEEIAQGHITSRAQFRFGIAYELKNENKNLIINNL